MSFLFAAWGSHWDKTETPYLTAAAAIGMSPEDIQTFIRRLDKVLASKSKAKVQKIPKTPTVTASTPVNDVERNGSPGGKKLTYV